LTGAAIITMVGGYYATTLQINPTLERLRSVTEGAEFVQAVTKAFSLPADVVVVLAKGAELEALLEANEMLSATLHQNVPSLTVQSPSALLPSARTQAERRKVIANVPPADTLGAALEEAGVAAGFKSGTFTNFSARLARMLDHEQSLTLDGYKAHGLGDVMDRLITRSDAGWMLATYAFPKTPAEEAHLRAVVDATQPDAVVTGLSLVNEELSASFLPQFLRGLGAGSAIVIILIFVSFRDWRLGLLTLVPTAIGLVWAAGILGIAGFELDLFSVFAVVTFVGIGVDYGVHLVHRYRDRRDALSATSELAPVILVAGAITLLGYGTLIWSSYPPLRSIGIVSAVSVLTLVAASVVVLPALLPKARS